MPNSHASKPGYVTNLGNLLLCRFERFGEVVDIDRAIQTQQQAVDLTPSGHASKSRYLSNLGLSLFRRFELSGEVADIDRAIQLQQQVVNLTPSGHGYKSRYFSNLGMSFLLRFKQFGEVKDIDQAIQLQQQAVNLTPNGFADKPRHFSNLGIVFQSRFEQFGKVADLDQAIQAQQQALDLTPSDYADKPVYSSNLGNSFQNQFERFDEVADIDQAIQLQQQAINLTPSNHADKPTYFSNLGSSFQNRFKRFGQVADIDQAIQLQKQAVTLTPSGHTDKPTYLSNLGVSFQNRFERFGNVADIYQAIQIQQQAVDLTPSGHADRPAHLSNLGSSFLRRFEWFGEVVDIDQAIQLQQQAVDLNPSGLSDKPGRLRNLGNSFLCRFERFGELADIDKAIQAQQQAVDLTPSNHADKPTYFSNLGSSFQNRFKRFGQVADIDQAIQLQKQAVTLTPSGHADKPSFLNNLGNSLLCRFKRLREVADIDQAIQTQQQAVDLTPSGHANKPAYFSNLGISFQNRFERFGKVADINQAIQVHQLAVNLTPNGHADKARYFTNLGISFQSRFKRFGEVADIDQAVQAHQQAVDHTPNGHASKPTLLRNLGSSFSNHFNHTLNINRLQHAIYAYSASALSSAGSPHIRHVAARQWTLLASTHPLPSSSLHLSLLRACHTLMALVPRTVWLGNSVSLRYQDIASISESVAIASSIACSSSRLDLALEWIEQGRSIVWGQMLYPRTPLDNLRHDHPSLASSLQNISSRLELIRVGINNQTYNSSSTSGGVRASLEQDAQQHRRLAEEWEELLRKVRQCSGYEQFLLPKTMADLAPAATSGPMIFVNITEMRCDALILQNIKESPQLDQIHLSLASLAKIQSTYNFFANILSHDGFKARTCDVDHLSTNLSSQVPVDNTIDRASYAACAQGGMQDVLEILWDIIVKPVIKKLGYKCRTSNTPNDPLPHVTWCTTGPLAFLPLHAAGCYSSSATTTQERTYNYMVSSYAPSISTLVKQSDTSSLSGFHGLTAISQPSTAGSHVSRLPGTIEEVKKIQGLFPKENFTWLNETESTRATVLEKMNQSSWLHLACHGVQKKDNPMGSAFILYDGSLDLHTISQKNLPNARLAFLSACQTATGDEKLPNEAAHLAAGLLMIGYHSVVGTMWSIKDQDAPLVAEEFYRYLIAHGMKTDKGEAAYALQEAVGRLRGEVGEDQFARWVPFIHLGI